MSSLTSQQINDTYAGLIKLADSTTGITDNFQYIQDGLGNNLPLQVKNGQIQGQNIFSYGYFVPDYEGPGFTTGAATFPANSQNVLISNVFYNPGLHSYSAITYRVQTATTTSDTAELAFYSAQFVNGYGLQPKDLVMSGITLETGSTGIKTTALPSTMSFSGFGSGIYFAVMKVSNSGVQPTIRFSNDTGLGVSIVNAQQLGVQFDASGTVMISPWKQTGTQAFRNAIIYSTLSTFKTSFDPSDFSGGILNASYNGWGFALNVIK
jgi:hypothetical protein